METPKKIAAYIQAGISILVILCTFLPFITIEDLNNQSFSLSFWGSLLPFSEFETKYQLCGYIFIIYFMLHVLNVFVQAHRSQRAFSCLLSIIGFTLLIVTHVVVSKIHFSDLFPEEFMYSYEDAKIETSYDMSFYLIIVLLVALILLPSLVIAAGNNASSRENDDQDSGSSFVNSKADAEKEIEALKAQIKNLENNNK